MSVLTMLSGLKADIASRPNVPEADYLQPRPNRQSNSPDISTYSASKTERQISPYVV
jgi:hypothetical protein